ncbi:MAG TPA: hypothetical protein VES01_10895 [Dermatophilaceae bacterium]|nr:hypothetical protein [Dermatophilaceae bacterium]
MAVDRTRTVMAQRGTDTALVGQFRTSLLALSGLTLIGAVVELTMLRHWNGAVQLIPWLVLVVLAVGMAAYAARPNRSVVRAVRVIAVAAAAGSALGVWQHVRANLTSAAFSVDLGDSWESMSTLHQWWLASTGGAGAVPPLAPGFLALTGIILALSTLGRFGDLGWLERLVRRRAAAPADPEQLTPND